MSESRVRESHAAPSPSMYTCRGSPFFVNLVKAVSVNDEVRMKDFSNPARSATRSAAAYRSFCEKTAAQPAAHRSKADRKKKSALLELIAQIDPAVVAVKILLHFKIVVE